MASSWEPFPDTILRFPKTGLTIDLRLPLARGILQQLADLGLNAPFAIITGSNPLGSRLDETGNRRLARVLASVVQERYPAAPEAHGRSPDGRHEEPGWAITAPLEAAKRLAAQFLQEALFWFDGERFLIVPVLGKGTVLALPSRHAGP